MYSTAVIFARVITVMRDLEAAGWWFAAETQLNGRLLLTLEALYPIPGTMCTRVSSHVDRCLHECVHVRKATWVWFLSECVSAGRLVVGSNSILTIPSQVMLLRAEFMYGEASEVLVAEHTILGERRRENVRSRRVGAGTGSGRKCTYVDLFFGWLAECNLNVSNLSGAEWWKS